MEKQKLRSEISDDDKWDLTLIYRSDDDFYKDFNFLSEKIIELKKYKKILTDNINNFKKYLNLDEEVERLFNFVSSYSGRKFDEDTTNVKYQKMSHEVKDLQNEFLENTSFVLPLIYKNSDKIINEFLKDKDLIKYKRHFEELLRFKPYTLAEDKENMLAILNKTLSSSDDSYCSLTDTDITFPIIKNEEDNDIELTESNFSTFIRSKNRRVRIEAFKTLLNTYAKYKNTITSIYTGHIDSDIAITKIRGYNSTLERYLFSDKIDISIYNNLIDTVSSRRDVINNYFGMLQNVLNVSELHRYDIYTGLIDNYEKKYSYNEAKDLVLKSLSVLGNDYQNKLKEAFDNKWIDVYNSKGKRSGAYSAGNFDTAPYILLNYEGELNDVSTLAHELGHSMHTYYSKENNDRLYADYKIFVAEVASITNELLLNEYLLKNSTDRLEKISILDNLIKLYYGTIVRQTMFAEFEKITYSLRENNQALTHDILEKEYYNLCKKYFGDNVYLDEEIKYEWERIPHFYYGFYVYKYATSLAASTYIANNILKDKDYLNKYVKFLCSGGSMDPLEELKLVDIDLSKKEVINEAMDKLNYHVEEFKKLYKNI